MRPVAQQMKPIAQGREWVAQLVRQRGEELVLVPVGFAQRLERAVAQLGGLQQRPDAHQELARAERLGEVVVRAFAETLEAGFLSGARRQQHDRHVAQRGVGAQLADQPEAVEVRPHDVGNDQIGSAARADSSAARPSAAVSTS